MTQPRESPARLHWERSRRRFGNAATETPFAPAPDRFSDAGLRLVSGHWLPRPIPFSRRPRDSCSTESQFAKDRSVCWCWQPYYCFCPQCNTDPPTSCLPVVRSSGRSAPAGTRTIARLHHRLLRPLFVHSQLQLHRFSQTTLFPALAAPLLILRDHLQRSAHERRKSHRSRPAPTPRAHAVRDPRGISRHAAVCEDEWQAFAS
mmetsp:Transcript_9249/g.22715  ORF Transcript_9249/g.22715 Transcript_9249/m.22715 type:complete len:204 (+) Transcript_9249:197-808(+)